MRPGVITDCTRLVCTSVAASTATEPDSLRKLIHHGVNCDHAAHNRTTAPTCAVQPMDARSCGSCSVLRFWNNALAASTDTIEADPDAQRGNTTHAHRSRAQRFKHTTTCVAQCSRQVPLPMPVVPLRVLS